MNDIEASFKVSSYLKNLIGKELITNQYVAVFELVKNSFDADSKNIDVVFNLQTNKILITDDGSGMSPEDVQDKWLFIGFSEKKEKVDKNYSGNKGIGRFSCDRLGSFLCLKTKKDGILSTLVVDWTKFEINQKTEIQNEKFHLLTDIIDDKCTGTTIEISNLRDSWSLAEINKAKKLLTHLVSPFLNNENVQLSVKVYDATGKIIDNEIIKNDVFEYMQDKTVYIESIIEKDKILTKIYDKGRLIVSNVSRNVYDFDSVVTRVIFADESAKRIFKNKTGQLIKNYGNLFVYKNQFRVFPYGEVDYDIFNLDQRKAQGYKRNLGTREIIGYINIVDNKNMFIETTSRDKGFVENMYTDSLYEYYMEYVHRPLEKFVQLISFGNVEINDLAEKIIYPVLSDEIKSIFKFSNSTDVFIDYDFVANKSDERSIQLLGEENLPSSKRKDLIKNVQKHLSNKDKELKEIKNKASKQSKQLKRYEKELKLTTKYIKFNEPFRQTFLEHDLNIVIASIEEVKASLFEKTSDSIKDELVLLSGISSRLTGIRQFLLRTDFDTTQSSSNIDIGVFLSEYSSVAAHKNIKKSVYVDGSLILNIDVFDIITIFDNLLENAFQYNATYFKVFVDPSGIKFVSDTYDSFIKDDGDLNRVFEFGYSTSDGGTGIGLYLVKNLLKKYGFECFVETNEHKRTFEIGGRYEKHN